MGTRFQRLRYIFVVTCPNKTLTGHGCQQCQQSAADGTLWITSVDLELNGLVYDRVTNQTFGRSLQLAYVL